MPIIFDTGTLVRPAFTAAEFTATKWDAADEKAKFANNLCRFIALGFKPAMFTKTLYNRLSMTFGHIAHYDRHGFVAEFFADLRGNVAFLEQTLMWRPCGDPAWTYSDVEQALLQRLRACDLLTAYRRLRAAEVERGERQLLSLLQARYEHAGAPAPAPVLHCPPIPKASITACHPAEQTSLFEHSDQRGRSNRQRT